jgi:8-oxo-dGTP pyrophosphatase MutT (NUDIX family)
MHRRPLLHLLSRYEQRYPGEREMVARIRHLVAAHLDCFERTCRPGHVTASAWVTTPERDKFLLVHHRKLGRWLQPGGHTDGDDDIPSAALREVREETGLANVRMADVGPHALPLDVDVHKIPARYSAQGELIEDAHEHHDVRVLVVAEGDLTPTVSNESHAVRWFTADEVLAQTDEESVLRMLRKVLQGE